MSKFLDGTGLSDLITKIKNAFVAKADTAAVTGVGVDSTPIAGSTNLVTSGGVYQALQGAGTVQDVTVDGTSVVENKVAVIPAIPEVVAAQELSIDSTPTANSSNLVTSGGVYSALQNAGGGFPTIEIYGESDFYYIMKSDVDKIINSYAPVIVIKRGISHRTYLAEEVHISNGAIVGESTYIQAYSNNASIFKYIQSSDTVTYQGLTYTYNSSANRYEAYSDN